MPAGALDKKVWLAMHKIAIVQGRLDPRARAYLERKRAEGNGDCWARGRAIPRAASRYAGAK